MNDALRPFAGQEVVISIRPKTKKRSNPQNRYYFGVCVKMIRDRLMPHATSEDAKAALKDEEGLHAAIKVAVGVSHAFQLNEEGDCLILEGRTKDKEVKAFQDYIINVQEWAARVMRLVIPDPTDPGYQSWLEEMMQRENEAA